MEFSEFNLHPDLQKGLSEAGYINCMPVQEQVLKQAFGGQDLYVQSQTGTGKTAAFLVVIFQRLLSEAMLNGKKAIIMVPTRELAVQVEEEAKVIGKYLPFKTGSFYGGVGYTQQSKLLRDDVQILVGTPGRVLDLNQSGQMNLMEIAFLVLDEADRMFDMGFYPDLRKLIRAVPPANRRQTMLFSATLNAWVKNLAWEYTKNPFEIAIEPETITVDEVEQVLYHVSSSDKMKLLLGILKRENPESAVIFSNTKRYAEIVAKRLKLNGFDCEFIMGDLPQTKRQKIINNIKEGKLNLLVATDVAARGLDIEGLALVVNYDLPNEAENYVHRIGRTARAGKTGLAITLASEQDVYQLPAIERYIGRKLPSVTVSPELLTEDTSEGRQIRTDYYEDRDERQNGKTRSGSRRGERSRRETPSPRRGQETRPKTESPRAEAAAGESRKETRGKKARLPQKERQSQKGQTSHKQSEKLSELSFEQRMAYYREKYDKGSAKEKPTARPKEQRANSRNSDNRRDKADGRKKPEPAKGRGKRPAKTAVAEIPTENGVSSAAPPPEAKKGLLSKFLGLFKKPSS